MQHRTRRHRHLVSTRPALQKSSRAQLVRRRMTTSRTPVAIRPEAVNQIAPAVIVGRETALELSQGARKIRSDHGLKPPVDLNHNI